MYMVIKYGNIKSLRKTYAWNVLIFQKERGYFRH